MQKKALPIYKTAVAEKKLIEIAKWSAKKWGQKVALHYLEQFNKAINLVALGLLPTKKNKELSTRFSYCLVGQHYIFFEIQQDKLIIATLFHTAMHVKERFKEERMELSQELIRFKKR